MDEKNTHILQGYILDITNYNENGYIVKATLSPKTRKKQIKCLTSETEKLFKLKQNYTGPSHLILDFMKLIEEQNLDRVRKLKLTRRTGAVFLSSGLVLFTVFLFTL